jgi:hypothetical protein
MKLGDCQEDLFVKFSAEFCEDSSVSAAIETLWQQQHLNANVLLFMIWYGLKQYGRLSRHDIKTLVQATYPWHDQILKALIKLRSHTANFFSKERAVNFAFIEEDVRFAKKIEQKMLSDVLVKMQISKRNPAQQLNDVCGNIANYCKALNQSLDSTTQQAITTLLKIAFPNLIASEIANSCEASLNVSADLGGRFSQMSWVDF